MHNKENNKELAKRCFKEAREYDRLSAIYAVFHLDEWVRSHPVRASLYGAGLCLVGVCLGVLL